MKRKFNLCKEVILLVLYISEALLGVRLWAHLPKTESSSKIIQYNSEFFL